MYLIELLKKIFRDKNLGIIIYLILNIFVVVMILSSFFASNKINGILFGIIAYLLSVSIALSPIGEWLLRLQTNCKVIKRVDYLEKLNPLFEEVYNKAKEIDPSISSNIKLYMNDNMEPNAFATGRNTICLTKGLLSYTDDEIKAIFSHEFGHLRNKDTDLLLLITVGNFIIMFFFIVFRLIFRTTGIIASIINRSWGTLIITLFIDTIYVAMFSLWTRLGAVLVLHSSRRSEYEADKFAFDTGYGYYLAEALDKLSLYSGERSKGIFDTLMSSHPRTDDRIAKLQELGVEYRRTF